MDRYQTDNRQLGYRQINRQTTTKLGEYGQILNRSKIDRKFVNWQNSDIYQTAMIQTDTQVRRIRTTSDSQDKDR